MATGVTMVPILLGRVCSCNSVCPRYGWATGDIKGGPRKACKPLLLGEEFESIHAVVVVAVATVVGVVWAEVPGWFIRVRELFQSE